MDKCVKNIITRRILRINNFPISRLAKVSLTFLKADKAGQSLTEIVLAIALFALMISFLYAPSFQGLDLLSRSSYYMTALHYLNEGEEALRFVSLSDWDSLTFAVSGIASTSNTWVLLGEGTVTYSGDYYRQITFSDIYRDAEFAIVDQYSPGASRDLLSKYAVIEVSKEVPNQKPILLKRKILLSRYNFE